MEISLLIAPVLYGIMVIIFLVLSFFLLYHAVRFGQVAPLNLTIMIVYCVASAALIIATVQYIDAHDWSQTIDAIGLVQAIFF